ncbi:GntR family transcriptional regulator [Nesterenkonia haasae]|uniref:GntR family transcriptional regulator n=1 Tax=Nesterenkonia haasae TaxID=2587813 RepID=UPI0013913F2C|nr:GntR family transcriptional regulator [Nesterenkonia haasae]NDK30607.1 GntR family transcriptional regulator [Nesterenkonia haasae]
MDIVISERSDMPIYEQIHVQLAAQVLDSRLEPNAMLPSIRTVARELGISVITIKKAWELLEADDLIYTRPGKGAFVSAHPPQDLRAKRQAFAVKRFHRDAAFYRGISITRDELISIVHREY